MGHFWASTSTGPIPWQVGHHNTELTGIQCTHQTPPGPSKSLWKAGLCGIPLHRQDFESTTMLAEIWTNSRTRTTEGRFLSNTGFPSPQLLGTTIPIILVVVYRATSTPPYRVRTDSCTVMTQQTTMTRPDAKSLLKRTTAVHSCMLSRHPLIPMA